jgi:hypothetical protein
MKNYIPVLVALYAPVALAGSELSQLEHKAMQRDYQAQRNLAYAYQTGQLDAPKDFFQACVWRTVIVRSGDQNVDTSDASNLDFACGRLTPIERVAAVSKGESLAKRLYKR